MARDIESSSTTEGLPVAPSLGPGLASAEIGRRTGQMDKRVILISLISIGIAFCAGFIARILTSLIGLITNLAFYQRVSTKFSSPAGHHLGYWVILVPVAGGVIVGFMARYGSKAIRGHGIPEAMENVLFNESKIPARVTFLKPISAAIAIGTGGPFGAEGPIIATGGALGSLVGQIMKITADERKTLLAAGAAAGMSATFGSPVSAVLLAIELLLFEYRARSLIPVALATATANGVRIAFVGNAPAFPMPMIAQPESVALACYVGVGALVGLASVAVTRAVYWIEDLFEELPIHWMWWPAIGALAVGVVGVISPHTMGVGYDNIIGIVSGSFGLKALAILCGWKLVSWAISLGSGTSGGTLAPLFTIGGGAGALLAAGIDELIPTAHLDPRIGALVGMAAMFAGSSRALLTSVVFAFETTRQPLGLLPLLGGCTAAYLVSSMLMRNTIMTEKLVRRGVRIPSDYAADFLDQVMVKEVLSSPVIVLDAAHTVAMARELTSRERHNGYPVVEGDLLVGVITRHEIEKAGPEQTLRDLITRQPVVAYTDLSVREAADLMVTEKIGRLPVVERSAPRRVIGILTRSDLLEAHERRIAHANDVKQSLDVRKLIPLPRR